MSNIRSRFQGLERPRPGTGEGESPLANEARFSEAVPAASPAETAEAPPPQFGARFSEAPLLLDGSPVRGGSPSDEAPPFHRCASCERDNGRFDSVCAACGASLETPQQKAFNEQLWATRREQDRATEQVLAERRQEGQGDLTHRQRAMAEALARESGDRARSSWMSGSSDGSSIGVRLLRRIPDARVLGAIVVALVVVGSYAAWQFVTLPRYSPQWGWRLVAVVLAILFVPPRRYWWSRRFFR